jgi:hypothetical protein
MSQENANAWFGCSRLVVEFGDQHEEKPWRNSNDGDEEKSKGGV